LKKRDRVADWKDLQNACKEAGWGNIPCTNYPDAYYPEKGKPHEIRLAKKGCAACPIIEQCAEYAIDWELEGVWGGLTANDRRTRRKGRSLL
jgi:WhiB family redox-sensing transcriptional regulator